MKTFFDWMRWIVFLGLLLAGLFVGARAPQTEVYSATWPDALFVGDYRSQDFVVRWETRWFALSLQLDGSARIDFPPVAGNEAVYVRAQWRNHGDGTITVTQLADIDAQGNIVHTYTPPLLFSDLLRLEDGSLYSTSIVLPDGSQPLFTPRTAKPY